MFADFALKIEAFFKIRFPQRLRCFVGLHRGHWVYDRYICNYCGHPRS